MQDPFFSIIVPTYNSGKTLARALKSIFEQDFNDVEIVIVDGLSSDNTTSIVTDFQQSDNYNIKLISEKDHGIYDAMNKGIKLATGHWLYFLGSDDYLYQKGVLGEIHSYILTGNFDLVYGKVFSGKRNTSFGRETDRDDILFENICHQAIFYKKEIFERIGEYNQQYSSFADWDFNIRCFFSEQVAIGYVNVVVAYFSDGGESTVNPDYFFLRNNLFEKKIQLLNDRNIKRISIVDYDKWWRFVRSLNLDDQQLFDHYLTAAHIPAFIKKLIKCQSRISRRLLLNGYFSKLAMTWSYMQNLLI